MAIHEIGTYDLEQGQECKCDGCMEYQDILDNGYCEECFDQGCDNDEGVH